MMNRSGLIESPWMVSLLIWISGIAPKVVAMEGGGRVCVYVAYTIAHTQDVAPSLMHETKTLDPKTSQSP